MRVHVWLLTLALALASVRPASAAEAAGVVLDVAPTCRLVDVVQLERLLDIEARRRNDIEGARIDVGCRADIVTLRVELRRNGSLPRSRDFSVRDATGDIGARVLSLAAVELLDDALDAPKPIALPEAPEPEPPAPLQATPSRARFVPSVRLMAAGAVHTVDWAKPLAGGGISVDYVRLAPLGLRLQFDMAVGSRRYDLGTARVRLTTLSAQAGYLMLHETWMARAQLGYRFGTGRIAGERVSGLDVAEGTVAGAFGGPLLSAGLGLRADSLVAELGAEAGLVSFPLHGEIEGSNALALDGYWLGLSLNVGALL